jgi:O-antigen/teichoic acid export membrane protein
MANQHSQSSSWSRERALFHFRRFSLNALLQIGSQVLPLIAGAVAIPLVYKNIGRAEFGVFTIGLSALGLFALLDLGLGRAAVRFMARAFSDNNLIGAASVAAHSALLLGGFSLMLSIALFAMTPAISAHWFHFSAHEQDTLRQCLYILTFALPFAGLTSVFRAVLEAKETFVVISIIQVNLGVLTYLVPLLLSFISSDVRVMIGGAVACRGFAFVAYLIAAVLMWRGPFPWRHVDLLGQHEFRSFSLWLVVSNLVGSAIVYGDRALLVRIFGLAEIPFYNVPLELLGRLMIVVNSAVTVIFPAMSRAAENKRVFGDVYVTLTTFLSVVIGFVLLLLSIFTPWGLHIWLGNDFRDHSTGIVRILLIGLAFQSLNVFALASLNARGFARPITFMHLIETPAYFWALYRCGLDLGLTGVALVWSGRLILEYACFAGFQAFVGGKEGRLMRAVGALIAACNVIPVAMLAVAGNELLALMTSGLFAALSVAWGSSLLRKEYMYAIK